MSYMSELEGDNDVKRCRTLTEKGKEYQISMKAMKKIRRVVTFVLDLQSSFQNCDNVADELLQLNDLFKDVLELSKHIQSLLDGEMLANDEEFMDKFDEEIFQFKTKAHAWLKEARNHVEGSSSGSGRSRRSKASRSRHEERVDVQVAAKVEAEITDRENVAGNLENAVEINKFPSPPRIPPKLAEEMRPIVRESSESAVESTSKLIAKMLMQQTAPDLDIDTFEGDPLEYDYFMATFKEAVESKIFENRGRLTRLIKYVKGEPKELIKHCIHEPADVGYQHAIELLKNRYGDPYRIISSYRKELQSLTPVKAGDATAFRLFYSKLLKCKSISVSDQFASELNSPDIIRTVQAKLPVYLQDKWNRRAFDIRTKKMRPANFNDFVSFADAECSLANDPLYSKQAVNEISKGTKRDENPKSGLNKRHDGFRVNITKLNCAICSGNHTLEKCNKFDNFSVEERKRKLFRLRLCFYCYRGDHQAKDCSKKKPCATCKGNHPTVLHQEKNVDESEEQSEAENEVVNGCTGMSVRNNEQFFGLTIVPVKLRHVDNPHKTVVTYALLDNCSQGSFIKNCILKQLGVQGEDTVINIKTMNGEEVHQSSVVNGIIAESYFEIEGTKEVALPRLYSKDDLPVDKSDILFKVDIAKWEHLNSIQDFILEKKPKMSVGILIGTNSPKSLEPRDVIPSCNEGPFAVLTNLGWSVAGPMGKGLDCNKVWCNRISVMNSDSYVGVKTDVQDVTIPQLLKSMYESEFNEPQLYLREPAVTPKDVSLSQEDRKFLKIMEENVQMKDGHYVLPLPFRDDDVMLPSNRHVAVKRAMSLKRKLTKNQKFYDDYVTFMNNLMAQGYAVEADGKPDDGKCWYIPHHGVYHPKKPEKIRVVFDCSAEVNGKSLNGSLFPGPDLANLLVGVFTRFRKEKIAVMADIEQMFYQVQVPEHQQDFLRFVWWPNGDLTKPLRDYKMCVHLFGGTSSPGCSNYALRKTADDNEEIFGREAAAALRRAFYVDDMAKSFPDDAQITIEVIRKIIEMCQAGGFKLTKFVSNSLEVMNSIDIERRKQEIGVDLSKHYPSSERALGIFWHIENDKLSFRITLKDKPLTRRGILSTISSIYDPLGLAAPYLLPGKRILQDMCREKKGWDEQLSDECRNRWIKWRDELPLLEKVSVNRCFRPADFDDVIDVSLHHFSDASEIGYGEVSYLRLVNSDDRVHTALVMGKSRVTPLKTVSVPRLELTAAVLSVKVSSMLRRELDIDSLEEYFWSDSQVVLAYLMNETKRFHTFVANRVQLIRENSPLDRWLYVRSEDNPGDDASRGLSCRNVETDRWFSGPEFLKEPVNIRDARRCFEIRSDDVETKKDSVTIAATSVKEEFDLLHRLEKRCSSWAKMLRVAAVLLKWKYPDSNDTVVGMKRAENVLLKLIQARSFEKEISLLSSVKASDDNRANFVTRKRMTKGSRLFGLDGFLDDDGLIRVGGRLKNSDDAFEVKYPVILPRRCETTKLIILHHHQKVEHQGRGTTLNELRNAGLYAINANSQVRYLIDKCVRCRYLRGKLQEQKMADLPEDRVKEAPPFSYCAVDMFGPFFVKNGRKLYKRYGALFTCMCCRGVHLESVHSMDADSFILALRRFIARRGSVRQIRSDNGTNFIGADRELRDALRELDHEKVKKFLLQNGCDYLFGWKKNPPTASHMGGVWERQIRSIRSILNNMMKSNGECFDDESFSTFLAEAECIVNSRPLTVETVNDVDSPRPLSPNHILMMKSEIVLPPPGKFTDADSYSRRRWRRVQHLLNVFWSRWRREYLTSFQRRSKWHHKKRSLQVGDVVLVHEAGEIRGHWPMGLVTKTFPDGNGNVRKVMVRMKGDVFERPVHKLVLLLECTGYSPPKSL